MVTKGTRLLGVVAVLALTFALFAVVTVADENEALPADTAVDVYALDDDYIDPEEINVDTLVENPFYISKDTTVKMKGFSSSASSNGIKFYVQNGMMLTLDFKSSWGSNELDMPLILIVTVIGDQSEDVINTPAQPETSGKLMVVTPSINTSVVFKSLASASVYYTAATVSFDVDYDRAEERWSSSGDIELDEKAQFSADKPLDAAHFNGIKTGVTVAPGQTLTLFMDSPSIPTLDLIEYGAIVRDYTYSGIDPVLVSGTVTLHSIGADLGSITLSDNAELTVYEAKVVVKNYDSTVKIDKQREYSNDDTDIYIVAVPDDGGLLYVAGAMKAGDITVSGKTRIGFTLYDGTFTISNKAEIIGSSNISVGGTLILKNEDASNIVIMGSGTVIADNTKLWNDNDPTTGIKATFNEFDGLIDTSAISKTAMMEKNISSSKIEINQTFELFGNTTVSNALVIEGILIIDEGVTLTVDKGAKIEMAASVDADSLNYAQIINYGTIVVKAEKFGEGLFVKSGKLINYGTINMASKSNLGDNTTSTIYSHGLGIENYGTISVSKSDYVDFLLVVNKESGNITVNGKFIDHSTIANEGRIVFNGAEIKGGYGTSDPTRVFILSKSVEATVYISSVVLGTTDGNSLMITDMLLEYDVDDEIRLGNSGLNIAATTVESTVRGLTIGETIDDNDDPQMTINGGVTVSSNKQQVNIELYALKNSSPGYKVADYGNFLVSSTLSIPSYVKLGYYSSGSTTDKQPIKFVVDGEMTFNKDAIGPATDEQGQIIDDFTDVRLYINGSIVSKEKDILYFAQYVGAKVENGDGDVFYLPFNNAVEYAITNDINNVDVGYVIIDAGENDYDYVTITEDVIIPSELSVQTVTIGDDTRAKI